MKIPSANRIVAVGALCVCGMLAGCGDGRPAVEQVNGLVTYRGKPVDGANVMFVSKEGRNANGLTDAEGRFSLTTFVEGDGAIVGEHVATVSKQEVVPVNQRSADFRPGGRYHGRYDEMRETLPRKYTSPISSDLKVTVKGGEPNDIKLELVD